MFPGEAIHLGGDEYFAAPWEDEEAQHPERFPSLVAHARDQLGAEATALDSYALFINALAARALELGRLPMLWNDHVVPAAEQPLVPISREVVIDVWIRGRAWTPSVTDYLDSGYRVVNSNGDLLYFVLSGDGVPEPHGRRRFGLLEDTFAPRRFIASPPRIPPRCAANGGAGPGAGRLDVRVVRCPTCSGRQRPSSCWTPGWCRSPA